MSRKQRIEKILKAHCTPLEMQVIDESGLHHVPDDAQSHFKVSLVSHAFDGLTRVARHRLVNHFLQTEFNQGLHALSLHLYSPAEWETSRDLSRKSPGCRDGFLK